MSQALGRVFRTPVVVILIAVMWGIRVGLSLLQRFYTGDIYMLYRYDNYITVILLVLLILSLFNPENRKEKNKGFPEAITLIVIVGIGMFYLRCWILGGWL